MPRRRELGQMLDPASFVSFEKIFSPQRTEAIASQWRIQTGETPRATDWNAASVLLGISYSYLKYPQQHSAFYSRLEKVAKQNQFGLWGDPLFRELDVTGNERLVNSECNSRNPSCGVFTPFTPANDCLTGIPPLS